MHFLRAHTPSCWVVRPSLACLSGMFGDISKSILSATYTGDSTVSGGSETQLRQAMRRRTGPKWCMSGSAALQKQHQLLLLWAPRLHPVLCLAQLRTWLQGGQLSLLSGESWRCAA